MTDLQPYELTAAITAIANALGSKLSTQKLTLLAAVFTQLGDTLATIALQQDIGNSENESLFQ